MILGARWRFVAAVKTTIVGSKSEAARIAISDSIGKHTPSRHIDDANLLRVTSTSLDLVGGKGSVIGYPVNPDRCEWPLAGWIDQKTFLIRVDIRYINACLFLILVPAPVNVAISDPRRLIHDLHIQISFNAVP